MVQKDAATTYKEKNPNALRGYWNSSEKKWGSIWMNLTSNKNKKQANKTVTYQSRNKYLDILMKDS